ncbi:MAG TPA: aminotransferase class I/II-fold pyridoxal phosphate-dependent enzyme [Verrucomicrobiae bacterium]|nr:aminotransferase class I/II-fold pyridoxal phosphate-dependent enzyme [Verrucomicrobiae bacterium]
MSLPFPVNPALKTLPVYQPGRPIEEVARELGLAAEDIIKLASNENPLGPSRLAMAAMRRSLAQVNLYPDGSAYYLKQKLASRLGLTTSQLILGNGSNEVIELLGHVLLPRRAQPPPEPLAEFAHAATGQPGYEAQGLTATTVSSDPEVVVSQYCFAVYPIVTALFGARLVTVPARNYGHDLDAMLAAITGRTRIVFVANPNNPTGTSIPAEVLRRFIEAVPTSVVIALDEAYVEFLKEPLDLLPELRAGAKPNLLLMRTFSKIYGLAGLRLGYGLGHPELIAELDKVRQPFNINSVAQTAALAALDDSAHVEKTRRNNARGLKLYEWAFRKLKLEFIPSAANFILVRVGDGQRVFEELQRRGIIARPMASYQLPEWLRISVGTPAQNRRCLETLQAVLESPQ